MAISFNQIPVEIRTPGQFIEFDSSRALGGLPTIKHKILVIGQRLAAGTVAEAIPTMITSAEQAEVSFGRGSMLSLMINALRKANRWTETWAIALDDNGAGVAAVGSVKFGGVVTAAGTLNLYIAGVRIQAAVASGEASATTATNVAAAIVAVTDLPVTAAVDGVDNTKVNLTARHKGEAGNDIDLRVNYFQGEDLPKGLTATFVAMVGGTGNPDVATVIAAIADTQYHSWILPYTDAANLTAIEADLAARWGPLTQIEGHAYAAARGTLSALSTLGNARNSEHLSIIGAQSSPTPPWAWAAALGGVAAFHGNNDPARPFQTLELTGVLAPAEADRFDRAERDIHLHDGISTFTVDSGGLVRIERAITTYQTNPGGAPDASYLDLNTKLTLAFLRISVRLAIALKFPRHKLANDGTAFGPGQSIVTPRVIRAELIALFRQWEVAGLAENIDQFKTDLIVERDANDPNRVNALIPPDIINQFRVFAAQVQFRL